MGQATYHHNLGDSFLHTYAVDPNLSNSDLERSVKDNDGRANPQVLIDARRDVKNIGYFSSFDELEVIVEPEPYQVPDQLKPYQEKVVAGFLEKGWFNGPVSISATDILEHPTRLRPGGFFDFISTQPSAVPADELPEQYPAGKTIAELKDDWGLTNKDLGRYFGFAHLMYTKGGDEICFVQRAKGMAIAPDCISSSGSTPNPETHDDLKSYWTDHIAREFMEEFKLTEDEVKVRGIYLFDDKNLIPFGAVEAVTDLSAEDLSQRIYDNEDAIKEHPFIYGLKTKELTKLIERFPIFPGVVRAFDMVAQTNK